MEQNIIQEQDCLEFLKSVDDKSVDLTFSDPPYNVKKDYGIYKDDRTPDEYKLWMQEIIKECKRISRKGIIFYVAGKLTKLFFELIPDAHLIPIYKKAAGVCSDNYMLQYHSLFSTNKPIKKVRDLWDDIRLPGEGYFFKEPRYDHPGLTCEALVSKVLEHWTIENDLIFDPFMGVGTTAVMCKKMKRNFVGTEINKSYINIANERLSKINYAH